MVKAPPVILWPWGQRPHTEDGTERGAWYYLRAALTSLNLTLWMTRANTMNEKSQMFSHVKWKTISALKSHFSKAATIADLLVLSVDWHNATVCVCVCFWDRESQSLDTNRASSTCTAKDTREWPLAHGPLTCGIAASPLQLLWPHPAGMRWPCPCLWCRTPWSGSLVNSPVSPEILLAGMEYTGWSCERHKGHVQTVTSLSEKCTRRVHFGIQ